MEEEEEVKKEDKDTVKEERTVFVKNLNFSTVESVLEEVFKEAGRVISCKIVRNSQTQLSRGYGFVEMESKQAAEKAIKKLQNFLLEEHALKLSLSKKSLSKPEEKQSDKLLQKRREREAPLAVADAAEELLSNKLMVKNLAFEATEGEIKELFKTYGALKKVRLPKKVNSKTHRGFGFVEFASAEEAKNAFKHLQHSHLYGRKLVIEWAKPDDSGFNGAEDEEGKKRQKNK